MSDFINIIIDGKEIQTKRDTTILDAAKANGIDIPTLCHDKRVEIYGACGLCVVEANGSPKLLRACATKVSEGMTVLTNTPRVISSRKCALDLLLSDHAGDCKAPCSLACPAGTDCQGYVGLVANGEYKEAVKLIKRVLPLPASIGRICPHPCETACRRQLVEEPIAIAAIKSFVGDIELLDENKYVPDIAAKTGKKIAIIGGGPGGLTAAYFLRLKGHTVKIYDMMPQMGGMLRYGIPEYRLPKTVLDQEIEIIKDLGIELVNNFKIGTDTTLDQLRTQNDAVVIAIGAWKSSKMRVKGEDLKGVIGGIDFLRETTLGNPPDIGKRVAVCGGGNTAMDACRTAVRLGAKEVTIVYRRTRDEMPAEKIEIDEAEEEGVIFKFLTNPEEITGENGKVTGMQLQMMQLGEPDESGRRKPVPVEGAFESIELDTVIMAIGQQPAVEGFEGVEKTKWQTIIADETSFRTSIEGVFAIGDATNKGADIAIAAIGEAHKAASIIDGFLNGSDIRYKKPYLVQQELTADDFMDRDKLPRAKMPGLEPDERKHNFKEISFGFSKQSAIAEASRCLECGCHDFFECKLIKLAHQYEVTPAIYEGVKRKKHEETAHPFIEQNAEKCVLCGLCVRVCDEMMGVTALGLVDRGFETVVSPEFCAPLTQTDCIVCGQCVLLCPTGALRERTQFVKSVPVEEHATLTTCPGCAVGCQIDLRSIGKTLVRALPAGEKGLLCAEGRFGFGETQSRSRVLDPLIRIDGTLRTTSLDEAIITFVDGIKKVVNQYGASAVGVALSERFTMEEAYLAVKFANEVLHTDKIFTFGINEKRIVDKIENDKTQEIFKRLFGDTFIHGANAYGFKELLGIKTIKVTDGLKALIIFGDETPANLPTFDFLAVCGTILTNAAMDADVFIPASAFTETDGTFCNSADSVQTVNKVVEPKNGIENWQLIQKLAFAIDENAFSFDSLQAIQNQLFSR